MHSYVGATIVAKFTIFVVGLLMLFAGSTVGAEGADSRIQVMVCPTAEEVQFSITQPDSDSIVNESKVVLSGSTSFISQVDIHLNDAYNNTLALSYDESSFESPISLRPGTNTIKVVATGTCGVTSIERSVVITYQPKVQPSTGQNVDTQVDGKIASGVRDSDAVEPGKSIAEEIIDNIIVAPIVNVGKSLDVITLPAANGEIQWQNTIRSMSFVFGVMMILSAGYVWRVGSVPAHLAFLSLSYRQIIGGWALAGIAVLVLVFIL
jgi:hypothetical protein